MQKTSMLSLIQEEIFRAFVFVVSFFSISVLILGSIAYAANDGGVFGVLLQKILLNENLQDPNNDGTVKNAKTLDGKGINEFIKLNSDPINRSCDANKCIYGFDSSGKALCR